MLKFHVPAGIGDISWCYSKVSELSKQRQIGFIVCGDQPRRSHPFVNILPRIVNLGYSKLSYVPHIQPNILPPKDTNLAELKDATYYLGLNPWLEAGHPLNEAFPHQPTDYHYALHLPHPDTLPAVRMLRSIPHKKIGLYCSSNRHRPDLGMWTSLQWLEFLRLVKGAYPDAVFVAIGAPYDDKTNEVADLLVNSGHSVYRFLNQPPCQSFRIMETLSYFFAFPSGLGIMADVLRVPCMMWYWANLGEWKHMGGLFTSYADPETLQSGAHIVAPYASVDEAFRLFSEKGAKHVR